MRWSRQPPIPFITEQEREAKAQEREKGKEVSHAQMLAALQGSPMANPEFLKDKAPGKCLICRQAGQWAKECPNCGKYPKTACYKCHQLGHWAALCPRDQEPQGQAPSLSSRWFNRTEVVHSSQPTCHRQSSQSWSQGCNWMWQEDPRISWLTQVLPTLS